MYASKQDVLEFATLWDVILNPDGGNARTQLTSTFTNSYE